MQATTTTPTYTSDLHQRLALSTTEAFSIITSHLAQTPLRRSAAGSSLFMKMENLNKTGSFKIRGALSAAFRLTPEERSTATFTTSSTGNHALACIEAFRLANVRAKIFMPETVSEYKLSKIRGLLPADGSTTIELFGKDCAVAEARAREVGGSFYISPYNDLRVAGGQGTIALEIQSQLESEGGVEPKEIFVPVGGGGLICGIAATAKMLWPNVKIVGVSPVRSACLDESVKAGRILGEGEFRNEETISEGTAGGVDQDSFTLQIGKELVDSWIQVDEDAIRAAVREIEVMFGDKVEGAAGLALAGWRSINQPPRSGVGGSENQCSILIVCGGNTG